MSKKTTTQIVMREFINTYKKIKISYNYENIDNMQEHLNKLYILKDLLNKITCETINDKPTIKDIEYIDRHIEKAYNMLNTIVYQMKINENQ